MTNKGDKRATELLSARVCRRTKALLKQAADREGVSLSKYIRWVLEKSAEKGVKHDS